MNWIDSSMSNKSYSSLISSYYASEIMPNYSNVIKNNISKIQLTKLPKEFLIENDDESDISKLIENTLRQKYNFVIPAIEIHINPNSKIELIKEDLGKFFEIFGEIEFINISSNSTKVYILYKYYFSAMYAYYAMNDILSGKFKEKDENNLIKVKMFDDSYKRPQKNCANENVSNNLLENSKTPIKLNCNNINVSNDNKKNLGNNQSLFPNQNKDVLSLDNNIKTHNNVLENNNLDINNKNNNYQNNNLINNNVQFKSSLLLNQPSFIPFKEKFQLLQKQMLETREKIFNQQIQIQKQQIINQQQILQRQKLLEQQQMMKNQINQNYLNNQPNIDFQKMTLQMKNDIKFNTYSNREYMYKYVCNYSVQIENDEAFNVTKRIIGKNGYFLKKIIYEGCIKFNDYSTKIRLRGKGSGYKEGNLNEESDEPLELCISSLNYSTYANCCRLVESLLKKVYSDYYQFIKEVTPISLVNAIKMKQIVKYEYVVNRFGNNSNGDNDKNDNYEERKNCNDIKIN